MPENLWREYHIDATGPRYGSSFLVEDFLQEGETLYRVLAAQRIGRRDALRADTLRDLTDQVVAGRLYWDLPAANGGFTYWLSPLTDWRSTPAAMSTPLIRRPSPV